MDLILRLLKKKIFYTFSIFVIIILLIIIFITEDTGLIRLYTSISKSYGRQNRNRGVKNNHSSSKDRFWQKI